MPQPLGIQEPGRICICQWHDWWADYVGQYGGECPHCIFKENNDLRRECATGDRMIGDLESDVGGLENEVQRLESRLETYKEALTAAGIALPEEE